MLRNKDKRFKFDDIEEYLTNKKIKLILDSNSFHIFNAFFSKFPNINELILTICFSEGNGFIKIVENPNYKINNIEINFVTSCKNYDVYWLSGYVKAFQIHGDGIRYYQKCHD